MSNLWVYTQRFLGSNLASMTAARDPKDQVAASNYFVVGKMPDERRHLLNYSGDGDFPLHGLHTDQKKLSRHHIDRYREMEPEERESIDPPAVIHIHKDDSGNEVPWIENGHHRIAAALEEGQTSLYSRIYKEDS